MDTLYDNHNHGHKLAREDSSAHLTDYRGSVMEEDRRLALFGWNIEAVTLLILPMVQNKYVCHCGPSRRLDLVRSVGEALC